MLWKELEREEREMIWKELWEELKTPLKEELEKKLKTSLKVGEKEEEEMIWEELWEELKKELEEKEAEEMSQELKEMGEREVKHIKIQGAVTRLGSRVECLEDLIEELTGKEKKHSLPASTSPPSFQGVYDSLADKLQEFVNRIESAHLELRELLM